MSGRFSRHGSPRLIIGMDNRMSNSQPAGANRATELGGRRHWRWREHGLPLLVVGGLWYVLIRHLAVEWSINPQYNYGWAVPFLCGYLIWRRWTAAAAAGRSDAAIAPPAASWSGWWRAAFVLGALAYGPTRLILEATPEWRVAQWTLALLTVGLTLVWLQFFLPSVHAPVRAAELAFPIAYFLVAVPWLRPVEAWVVQELTRWNVAGALELLAVMGVPALQHGNVIEVGTGMVGVDEACSGIRSFQATLMISLFLGELYRLRLGPRLGLVGVGWLLAFGLNVGRTTLLTWVAARQGADAVGSWHDPAGITILVGCFLGLWWFGEWLNRRQKPRAAPATPPGRAQPTQLVTLPSAQDGGSVPRLAVRLAVALGLWLVATAAFTEWWFRRNEQKAGETRNWHVPRPDQIPGAKDLGIAQAAREILRYTEGYRYGWREPDGTEWQMFYARWAPGRAWVKQVTRHAPTVCLRVIGWELMAEHGVRVFDVGRLQIGFHCYEFLTQAGPVQVYYCLWEDGARVQPGFSAPIQWSELGFSLGSQWARIQSALEGRRGPGMRVLELAVWGAADSEQADRRVREQLERLVRVEP